MKIGQSISGKREKLEKASERVAAHKKIKRQQISRVMFTIAGFALVAVTLYYIGTFFFSDQIERSTTETTIVGFEPTIEIVDADTAGTNGQISSRMKEYIGMYEEDIRALGYTPTKAVIPTGSIREIDFYLDGYKGYIKTILDRGTGVSAEDTDRMIRYLSSQGVNDFEYIDVRVEGKAYWK